MVNRDINQHRENSYAALLFLLWPFLAVVSALKNYKMPWAKNVIWAFTAFYGFTFAIGVESEGSDIVRYVAEYQTLHQQHDISVADAKNYFLESGEVDILRTAIAITLSRFTDSQPVLTLVYGIIFGFFFSRNMWFVMKRLEGKMQPFTIILLICLFTVIPIWDLGGFRMWTAAHIFVYGLLLYLGDDNKKGLIICCSAFLVHYSFIMPISILLFYVFAGNWVTAYFIFYVTTFFIAELDITALNNVIENVLPEILQERSAGYRSEVGVESYREGDVENRQWYAVWYRAALSWSLMGFLGVIYLSGRDAIKENRSWLNMYSFILLFYGVANLFNTIPSGGRYISIVSLLTLAFITIYVQNHPQEKALKRLIPVTIPALLLFIIVVFRTMLYTVSATTVLGNPVVALIFIGDNLSLNDVLRMIL